MSIRKRVLPSGQIRWQFDFKDNQGRRRSRQFLTQREAKSHETAILGEIKAGVYVPDSGSITVAQAGEIWLQECRANQLEASTLRNYRLHLDLHITPFIGGTKLSRLTRPMVESFKNRLLETERSRTSVAKVLISLSSLLSESQKRGLIVQNVALGAKVKKLAARHEEKAVVPTKDEIRALIAKTGELWKATDPWRAIVLCALLTGLRSSELRGLSFGIALTSKKWSFTSADVLTSKTTLGRRNRRPEGGMYR